VKFQSFWTPEKGCRAVLETVSTLRPSLHRYCARMTGSVMDGEDVVQEALIEAYRKLDKYDESRPLKPWLFRIAHNRCIDFLRRRKCEMRPRRPLPCQKQSRQLSRRALPRSS
jgi:RNA polymerase sigma factor (sigma-70 family)